jgi:deoxyhypusine synthase
MKKILKRIGLGLLTVFVVFLGLFVVPYFANIVMPWDRTEAIETALTWGGLESLPDNADIISVDTKGSMFTREFIIEFNCGQKELEQWIQNSGLTKLTPRTADNGIKIYQVSGKQGSIGGHVYIDKEKGNVIVDMSWS